MNSLNRLKFDNLPPTEAKSALAGLLLHVDGQKRAFSSASASVRLNTLVMWPELAGSSWSDGQKVSLSITAHLLGRKAESSSICPTCQQATSRMEGRMEGQRFYES